MNKLFRSTSTSLTPLLLLSVSTLVACGGGDSNFTSSPSTQTDTELRSIISAKNLTGDPLSEFTAPDINSATAQLGMRLFYSKSLGGDGDSACVTCHHPMLGGGDDLSLPIGTEAQDPDLLGPGRLHDVTGTHYDAGPTVPRNAPTTFNLAAWNKVLFHDGRLESLAEPQQLNGAGPIRTPDSAFGVADPKAGANLAQAQARFPVTSPEEMKGFHHDDKNNQEIRDFLAQKVGGYGAGTGLLADPTYWLDKFRDAFDVPITAADSTVITEDRISFAIGEYERSQVFVNTPWKSYVNGNNSAISDEAKAGALLFFNSTADGGADCSSCHSGDFFTDEGFHNLAMPQIGRGKGDGVAEDFGRFRETGNTDDKYAFRTPSLINTEVTGPWTHAGAYTSLEAVVRHHLNPQNAINGYDESQLTQVGIQNLGESMRSSTQKAIDAANFEGLNVSFTDVQVDNLVAFIKSLTDPDVKKRERLAPWILDGTEDETDPNGDQLTAKDSSNNTL